MVVIWGCGADANGKRAVSGTVTLNGAALDTGTITFLKLPEAATPEAACLITNGTYSIPAEQGLPVGNYQVKISSPEQFVITPEDYAAGKTAPPARERIPPNYNSQTTQTVEVKESGSTQFNFDIP
jgi:hypothetical protein